MSIRVRKSFITSTSWVRVQFGARSTIWSMSSYSRKFYNLGAWIQSGFLVRGAKQTKKKFITKKAAHFYSKVYVLICKWRILKTEKFPWIKLYIYLYYWFLEALIRGFEAAGDQAPNYNKTNRKRLMWGGCMCKSRDLPLKVETLCHHWISWVMSAFNRICGSYA